MKKRLFLFAFYLLIALNAQEQTKADSTQPIIANSPDLEPLTNQESSPPFQATLESTKPRKHYFALGGGFFGGERLIVDTQQSNNYIGYDGSSNVIIAWLYKFHKYHALRYGTFLGYANLKFLEINQYKLEIMHGFRYGFELTYLWDCFHGKNTKIDWGMLAGVSWLGVLYNKKHTKSELYEANFLLGIGLSIHIRHRVEFAVGIPLHSKFSYIKNSPITTHQTFRHLRGGLSYTYAF